MATPRKKYPRRFPRISTPPVAGPATPTPSPQQAQQQQSDYQVSVWRDIDELLKRVWALENQVSGPGGSITNITSTDNSVTITTVDNSTINITNAGGGGTGNAFFWALVLGGN